MSLTAEENAMTDSLVILVDSQDREIGQMNKRTAHHKSAGPHLHRAFSLFLFDPSGRLLLQQRSPSKITFPHIWANTCCSHPQPGESVLAAAIRRVSFEMNIQLDDTARLTEVGSFCYRADYDDAWAELEVDHVVFGFWDGGEVAFNREEVEDVRWITQAELSDWLKTRKEELSVWLQKIWGAFLAPAWEAWVRDGELPQAVVPVGVIDLISESDVFI
jgi:isopentenyl-diphosphate delta-isomerase